MRGETKPGTGLPYSAATIVDSDGTPRYHVLPSKLVTFGLLSMALLIVIALILGFLIFRNKTEIDDLRDKMKVEEMNDAR